MNEMRKQDMTQYYRGLLDVITSTSLGGEFQVLYRALDQIVFDKWKQGPLVVISRPKGEYPKEKWRIHWNRDVGKSFLESKDFQKRFSNLQMKQEIDEENQSEGGQNDLYPPESLYGPFQRSHGNGSTYLFLHFGDFNDQEYWGIFKEADVSLPEELLLYLGNYLRKSFVSISQWKEMGEMSALVYVDDVTGLFNQRKLMVDLEDSIKKYHEFKEQFSVLFLDIDYFKSVNDVHGHMVGTKVLKDLAALLNKVVRGSDMLYRYGGDEFVVILENAGIEVGEVVGGRILEAVAEEKFELNPGSFHQLTVSIGIAAFPSHASSKQDVLSLADQMMYHAKKGGRGQVRLATELFPSKLKKKA